MIEIENKTLVFLWQLLDKLWINGDNLMLYQEKEIETMINNFVIDSLVPIEERVLDDLKVIDWQILNLEKLEGQEDFTGQWELVILREKRRCIKIYLQIIKENITPLE